MIKRSGLVPPLVLFTALLACKKEEQAAPPAASATPPAAATPAASAAEAPAASAEAAEQRPAQDENPIPAIPEGRSKPPTVAEWNAAQRVNTQEKNSQPDRCFMKIVREWLKVNCTGDVTHVSDMEGFGSENSDFFQSVKPGKVADFVVRMRKGQALKLRIFMQNPNERASLFMSWPAAKERPTIVAMGKMAI